MISTPILLSSTEDAGRKLSTYHFSQIHRLKSEALGRNQHCATHVNFKASQVLNAPKRSF